MQFFTPDHLFKNDKANRGVAFDNEGRALRTSPKAENVAKLLAFSKALEIQQSENCGSIEFVMN